jgi:CrcB protein
MLSILLVGAGGFCGAVLRYLLYFIPLRHEFPLITLAVNIIGSFIIGFTSELLTDDMHKKFMQTGFCGGFTTFSAFSLESLSLIEAKRYTLAGAYTAGSIVLCIAGTYTGVLVAKAIKSGHIQ